MKSRASGPHRQRAEAEIWRDDGSRHQITEGFRQLPQQLALSIWIDRPVPSPLNASMDPRRSSSASSSRLEGPASPAGQAPEVSAPLSADPEPRSNLEDIRSSLEAGDGGVSPGLGASDTGSVPNLFEGAPSSDAAYLGGVHLPFSVVAPRNGRIAQLACRFSGALARGLLSEGPSQEGPSQVMSAKWRLNILAAAEDSPAVAPEFVNFELIQPESWEVDDESSAEGVVSRVQLPFIDLGAGQSVTLSLLGGSLGPGDSILLQMVVGADGSCRVLDRKPVHGVAMGAPVEDPGFDLLFRSAPHLGGGYVEVAIKVYPEEGRICS